MRSHEPARLRHCGSFSVGYSLSRLAGRSSTTHKACSASVPQGESCRELVEGYAQKQLVVPAGARDVQAFDDELPGFGIRKFNSGRASYFVKYAVGAQQRRLTLGAVVRGNLKPMRLEASRILAKARLGQDVAVEDGGQGQARGHGGGSSRRRTSKSPADRAAPADLSGKRYLHRPLGAAPRSSGGGSNARRTWSSVHRRH